MPKIPDVPDWQERTVTLVMVDGTRPKVRAKVYGAIAVSPAAGTRETGRWAVTSTTTGLQLGLFPSEEEALEFGRVVWERGCLAFRQVTREKIIEKVPPTLQTWIMACRSAGKVVPFLKHKETSR